MNITGTARLLSELLVYNVKKRKLLGKKSLKSRCHILTAEVVLERGSKHNKANLALNPFLPDYISLIEMLISLENASSNAATIMAYHTKFFNCSNRFR
jgi:hypothetical protein